MQVGSCNETIKKIKAYRGWTVGVCGAGVQDVRGVKGGQEGLAKRKVTTRKEMQYE